MDEQKIHGSMLQDQHSLRKLLTKTEFIPESSRSLVGYLFNISPVV